MKRQFIFPTRPSKSYWQFIWNVRENRQTLVISIMISIAFFILFKVFYPFPDFFGDSYSYIYAASQNLNISIWPIGYSKFLAEIHSFTWSDTVVISIQYFSMQLALLHLLFSVIYFYNTNGWPRLALTAFMLVNPLTFFICNTINSDAIFGTLTIFWITELIWVVQRPRLYRIFIHAILLFTCFTIRSNAYYYPLVGACAFLISAQKPAYKAAGILVPILFLVPFIFFTRKAAFKLTGVKEYSLFTGWQLANNALYIYDQIDVDSSDFSTNSAKTLNKYAIRFFRQINTATYRKALEDYVGNYFIRQPEAPLKQYYNRHFNFTDEKSNIINWANASVAFKPFGETIILQHPTAYLKYFVLPNIKHYFLPPLSHVGLYNYGITEIEEPAVNWFHYRSNKVRVISHTLQGYILLPYVGIFLMLNVYSLWNVIQLIMRGIFKTWRTPAASTLIFLCIFLIINFGFSITTTVNILRYQFAPLFILSSFIITSGSILATKSNNYARTLSQTRKIVNHIEISNS